MDWGVSPSSTIDLSEDEDEDAMSQRGAEIDPAGLVGAEEIAGARVLILQQRAFEGVGASGARNFHGAGKYSIRQSDAQFQSVRAAVDDTVRLRQCDCVCERRSEIAAFENTPFVRVMLNFKVFGLPLMTRFDCVNVTVFVNGAARLPPSKITTPLVRLITRVIVVAGGV